MGQNFPETEKLLRAWLEEAGFRVENRHPGPETAWVLEAQDALGSIGLLQKATEPRVVHVVCRVDLSPQADFIETMPDAFLYDLRLGLLVLGVNEMGVLARPLKALTPGVLLYLDGLTRRDLDGAIAKVRHAVTYVYVTFQKVMGAPLFKAPPEPTN